MLARTDGDLRLVGSRDVGTIMFTDIRGFTAFTEGSPPDRVLEILNQYFDEMIEAIFAWGGTLVGYRGDGLLVVFGAPIPFDDHADRALAAAREMLGARLSRFNTWLVDKGLGDGFRMGIGLNSGPFMSGNVGSARRLEYTVHGDTVNTASRIEGMTKDLERSILLADSTRLALLSPPDDLSYAGEFEVRGRASGINLWTLAGADPAQSRRSRPSRLTRRQPDRLARASSDGSPKRAKTSGVRKAVTSAIRVPRRVRTSSAMARKRFDPDPAGRCPARAGRLPASGGSATAGEARRA